MLEGCVGTRVPRIESGGDVGGGKRARIGEGVLLWASERTEERRKRKRRTYDVGVFAPGQAFEEGGHGGVEYYGDAGREVL